MSATDDLVKAFDKALDECPVGDVLSIVTGVFVGLTLELVRRKGHDIEREIHVDGGDNRDITIHAPKLKDGAA